MKKMAYLLNMSIAGIKNIEKEIKIQFYNKTVDKNFNTSKYGIKGIYGENGSGKTAIITAVRIAKRFMVDANYLREKRNQDLLGELINKKRREFVFKCEFVTNIESILIYEYEVHLSLDDTNNV